MSMSPLLEILATLAAGLFAGGCSLRHGRRASGAHELRISPGRHRVPPKLRARGKEVYGMFDSIKDWESVLELYVYDSIARSTRSVRTRWSA
jgi:hypothetical protein